MRLVSLAISIFFFSVNTTLSAQSLLQREYTELTELTSGEKYEVMHPILKRSTLPDHFFAESIMDQLQVASHSSNSIELEGGSAVFMILNSGNNPLEFLLQAQKISEDEHLFIYEIHPNQAGQIGEVKPGQMFFKKTGWIVVEWNGPSEKKEGVDFSRIIRNAYLHREATPSSSTGFGTSLECHINVNCPEGSPFLAVKDGIVRVRVVVEEGIGFCSGALINNTAQDETPYLLTAFHCMDGFTPLFDMWRFDFFYEGSSCTNPTVEPDFFSLTGAEYKAGHPDSDFMLLEITDPFPADFQVPLLGWDRREGYLPQNTALIHHPSGDIKKVSLYSNNLRVHSNRINWNNGTTTPAFSHYRQNLTSGTFEPGSSGSPLLSPEGRIMGQLHGGNSSCSTFLAYSGILYYSWDVGDGPEERLSDWLDPLNTGQDTLGPLLLEPSFFKVNVEGEITTPPGDPVGLVEVYLDCENGHVEHFTTSSDGSFHFELNFLEETVCHLSFAKDIDPLNGVNVLDIVDIRRHILQLGQLEGDQLIAADVHPDGAVNVLDIVQIRRLILELIDEFSDVDSWQMFPNSIEFELDSQENLFFEIKGIKMGDVNFSADPTR